MSNILRMNEIAISDYPMDSLEFEWRGLQCFLISCSGEKSTWSYCEDVERYELQDVNFNFVVIINGRTWELYDIEVEMHEEMFFNKEEVLEIVLEHLDDNQMELCTNP